MTGRSRTLLIVAVVTIFTITWLVLAQNCPSAGIALTSRARALHRLKNRTAFPKETEFNSRLTLDELLRPGDDTNRWSVQHSAKIEGYVIDVAYARPEATNCFSPCRRDIHILVGKRKEAAKNEQVIVEITPNFRDWAASQGMDWSEPTLQAELVGHWCEFEGWLYFDVGHTDQSENTAPGNPTNWRGTAWELHPVTKFRVVQ
jgi:hypothetical protein